MEDSKTAIRAKNKERDKARLEERCGDLGELIFELTEERPRCGFNTAPLCAPPLLCEISDIGTERAVEKECRMERFKFFEREAIELGFASYSHMVDDPDLEGIRADPRYAGALAMVKKAAGG